MSLDSPIYAKYILDNYPSGKIGVLYQNDHYGKNYLKGLNIGRAPPTILMSKLMRPSARPSPSRADPLSSRKDASIALWRRSCAPAEADPELSGERRAVSR